MIYGGLTLVPSVAQSASQLNLNNSPASQKFGNFFIAEESEIDCFYIRTSAGGGTEGYRKLTFDLYAESGGLPTGSPLQTYEKVGVPANSVIQISPSWTNSNLTVGSRYWIIITNTADAPATDSINITNSSMGNHPFISTGSYNSTQQWGFRTWNGSNWTTVASSMSTMLTIKFSSGALYGNRHNGNITYNGAWCFDGARKLGVEFKLPKNCPTLNLTAAAITASNGASTRLNVYINRALVKTSPYNNPAGGSIVQTAFQPLSAQLPPDTWIAIMTDAVTAANGMLSGEGVPNIADFISMKPLGGNIRMVKIEGGAWYTNELAVPALMLHLDYKQPFVAPSINRRKYFNQR